MLEQLDSIDWKSYDAEYMPALIRGLASPDQKVRSESYNRLESTLAPNPPGVWEDYDVSAIEKLLETDLPILVVPFFIELLQSESFEGKSSILQWLLDLSTYIDLEVTMESCQKRAQQVFEVVKTGIPTYQLLLNDRNPRVKIAALQLIEKLNRDS